MVQRTASFLVVLLLMFLKGVFAQEKPGVQEPLLAVKSTFDQRALPLFKPIFSGIQLRHYNQYSGGAGFTLSNLPTTSFYLNSLGFFCKKELQLDKVITIPLRFRLGSLAYVNWMEQKPNVVKPGL
jgi:hypothetical protein